MKYLEFNRNSAEHDLYRAPHITGRSFVRFASGEVIFTDPKPTNRRTNKDLGIQIVATGDDDCPALYREPIWGKPLPKAWLSQGGMQYLAIDHDCGVAVQLATGVSRWGRAGDKCRLRDVDHFAPHYLTGRFAAYWAGPGRRPIGDPITVSEPYRATKEQRQHLQDLKDQATAWATMKDLPQYAYLGNQGVPRQHAAHYYFDKQFAELPDQMKKSLHYYGWSNFRVETKHQYLYVRRT